MEGKVVELPLDRSWRLSPPSHLSWMRIPNMYVVALLDIALGAIVPFVAWVFPRCHLPQSNYFSPFWSPMSRLIVVESMIPLSIIISSSSETGTFAFKQRAVMRFGKNNLPDFLRAHDAISLVIILPTSMLIWLIMEKIRSILSLETVVSCVVGSRRLRTNHNQTLAYGVTYADNMDWFPFLDIFQRAPSKAQ